MMLRVRDIAWDDPSLADAWDALLAASPRAHVFQSRAWIRSWWDAFGADDPRRRSALMLVEDAGATPVALAPFFLQRRAAAAVSLWSYLLWMGHDLTPMQSLLCDDARLDDAWRAIVAHVRRTMPHAWFDLHDLDDATVQSLTRACTGRDALRATGHATCLSLALAPASDPVARADASLRRSLRRVRTWMREDGALRWTFEQGMGEASLARLQTLSLARFGTASFCAEAAHVRFLQLLAERLHDAMTLATLWHGETPVHVICGLLHRDRYAYFLAGMDPAHASHGPGYANLLHLFEQLPARGIRHFDFLRGDERYKRSFGPVEDLRHHVSLVPAQARRRHAVASALQTLRRGGGVS